MNARDELVSILHRRIGGPVGETVDDILAAGYVKLVLDDATVERVELALFEHRQGGLTCYDHDNGWCCVCGEHEIRIGWRKHMARAVLAAAVQEGR
jgi:hypothetical protein